MSEYEKERLANIAENQSQMNALGLGEGVMSPSKKKKKRSAEEAEEAKAGKQRRLEEARAAAEERKKSKIEASLIEKAELEDAITNKLLIVGKTVKIPVRSAHRDAAEM